MSSEADTVSIVEPVVAGEHLLLSVLVVIDVDVVDIPWISQCIAQLLFLNTKYHHQHLTEVTIARNHNIVVRSFVEGLSLQYCQQALKIDLTRATLAANQNDVCTSVRSPSPFLIPSLN